jgi:hypothetical protein
MRSGSVTQEADRSLFVTIPGGDVKLERELSLQRGHAKYHCLCAKIQEQSAQFSIRKHHKRNRIGNRLFDFRARREWSMGVSTF